MRQTCSTSRALEGKSYMSTSWSKAARRPTSDVVCLDFPTCFTSWVRTFLHTSVRRYSRTSRRPQRRLRTRVRHLQRRSAGTKLPRVPFGRCNLLSVFIQIQLALQVMKPVLEGEAKSFEIQDEVVDRYNGWLQSRLRHSVWTDCMSYYRQDRR